MPMRTGPKIQRKRGLEAPGFVACSQAHAPSCGGLTAPQQRAAQLPCPYFGLRSHRWRDMNFARRPIPRCQRGGLYSPAAARSAAALSVFWPALTSLRDMSFVHVRKAARAARRAYSPAAARSGAALWSAFTSLRDMNSAPKPKVCCANTGLYSAAAARSAWALSVFSQLNSGSSRPKWP